MKVNNSNTPLLSTSSNQENSLTQETELKAICVIRNEREALTGSNHSENGSSERPTNTNVGESNENEQQSKEKNASKLARYNLIITIFAAFLFYTSIKLAKTELWAGSMFMYYFCGMIPYFIFSLLAAILFLCCAKSCKCIINFFCILNTMIALLILTIIGYNMQLKKIRN